MAADGLVAGAVVQCETPDWAPLALVISEELMCTFMWMCEVRTGTSVRLHAYKHIETRRYLHLDRCGNAFVYATEGLYQRVELASALERVLKPWWEELAATPEEVVAAWAAVEKARCVGD